MAQDDTPSGDRTGTYSRRRVLAGGSAALLAGVAGCSGGGGGGGGDGGDTATETETESGGDGGATTTTTSQSMSEPEKPDSITVRAWGGTWEESVRKSIAEPFTSDTGIDVEFDNTDRTVMQGKIRTAIQQDRAPPVNVMWTTVTAAHKEYEFGLANPLDPEIVDNLDLMFDLATPDVDGNPPYLSMYSYTYALCYNEEELQSLQGNTDPVGSWTDLTDSMYEGNLGVYDNGYGLHPVLAALADVDLGSGNYGPMWDQLEAFAPSVGLVGDDTNLTQGITEGEVAYAQLLVNNIVDAVRNQDEPLGWTIPEEGTTAWQDSMYTPKNQDESHTYWSQVFINYAASTDVQTDWTTTLNLPMLNQDAEPQEWMAEDPAFPTTQEELDNLITPDPGVYVENSSTWYDQFSQIISA
jgi:putative spermidine/putrescine transport system substrate-binding protein